MLDFSMQILKRFMALDFNKNMSQMEKKDEML
jgi:hypothetical protein